MPVIAYTFALVGAERLNALRSILDGFQRCQVSFSIFMTRIHSMTALVEWKGVICKIRLDLVVWKFELALLGQKLPALKLLDGSAD